MRIEAETRLAGVDEEYNETKNGGKPKKKVWIENETKVLKLTCLNRDKQNPKGRFLYKCHNNMKLCPYYFFLNNTGEVTIIGFDRARTEDPKTASA